MKEIFSSDNAGLVLSDKYRMSLQDSFINGCIFAPTGMGKTTTFVIPNILKSSEASIVVTDPSGEIFENTSGHMNDRGWKIQVFKPTDLENSCRFNPCHRLKSHEDRMYLAKSLGKKCSDSEAIWRESAEHVMYLGLCALSNMPDQRYNNIPNLRWILNHMGGVDQSAIQHFMARFLEEADEQLHVEYLAFQAKDYKFTGSVLATAQSCLNQWLDPNVCRLTANDSIDIENLRKEKTILYLIIPEHKIPYYSVITNQLYSTCFNHCLENDGLPVFFYLDEFGNLGEIENFSTMATTLRKRKCSLNLILQDISQLEAIYGMNNAKTILRGGAQNRFFFGGLDIEVTKQIEERLGYQTEYDNEFGGVQEGRTVKVPLMSASDICMLEAEEVILISGNKRPVKTKLQAFYKDRDMLRVSKKKPVQPCHEYSQESVSYINMRGVDGLF